MASGRAIPHPWQTVCLQDSDVARMRAFLPAHIALEEHVLAGSGHEVTPAMAADLATFLT